MSKIKELVTKGRFLDQHLRIIRFDNRNSDSILFFMSNDELDKILKDYNEYLIKNNVCPICYNDLSEADKQVDSGLHCHNCGWIKKLHLSFTR